MFDLEPGQHPEEGEEDPETGLVPLGDMCISLERAAAQAEEFLEPGQHPEEGEEDPETGLVPLGDMCISLERAAAQAEEFGHSVERELSYLTVHSVLHLLGYDHLDEGPMKAQMRAREEAVLGRLGLTRKTEQERQP